MKGSRTQERKFGLEEGDYIGLALCKDMWGLAVGEKFAQDQGAKGDIEGARGCMVVVAGEFDTPALVGEHYAPLSCGHLLWKGVLY